MTYDLLTQEANSSQRRYAETSVGIIVDKAKKKLDKVRPLALRELSGGDGGNSLRGEGPGFLIGRVKSHEHVLLDLVPLLDIEREPALRVLGLPGRVLLQHASQHAHSLQAENRKQKKIAFGAISASKARPASAPPSQPQIASQHRISRAREYAQLYPEMLRQRLLESNTRRSATKWLEPCATPPTRREIKDIINYA